MEGLQIRKGGQLVWTYWYAKGKVREYREKTVTSRAPSLLFERTTLAPGVTLRDIFLLLEKHINAFDAILGNWCREIVAEGLGKRRRPSDGIDRTQVLGALLALSAGDLWRGTQF